MFSTRAQVFTLALVIFVSLLVTKIAARSNSNSLPQTLIYDAKLSTTSVRFAPLETANAQPRKPNTITRKWDVLDPNLNSVAVLVESLEDRTPLLHYNITHQWPLASITKLLTAVTVIEEIGLDKKIVVSADAVATAGLSGELHPDDIYTARDLLTIMLVTSSNDAAAAFEEHAGGIDTFVSMLNAKAREIGMQHTLVHDASGLSDLNTAPPEDIAILLSYIARNAPDILTWTRLEHFLVQPINVPESRTLTNVNPLVLNPAFLGGKTGTSPEARENLTSIISMRGTRLMIVILGSSDRINDFENLLAWIDNAYIFP